MRVHADVAPPGATLPAMVTSAELTHVAQRIDRPAAQT